MPGSHTLTWYISTHRLYIAPPLMPIARVYQSEVELKKEWWEQWFLFRFYIFSLSNFLINLLSDSPTCDMVIYPDSPLHLSFRSGVAKKVRFCWELTTTCLLHYLMLNFFLWPCPIVSCLHHHLLSSYLARICLIVAFCPCLQDCPFNKKSSFSCRILKTWNSEYTNSTIVTFKSARLIYFSYNKWIAEFNQESLQHNVMKTSKTSKKKSQKQVGNSYFFPHLWPWWVGYFSTSKSNWNVVISGIKNMWLHYFNFT